MGERTPTPWELFSSNGIISIKNPRSRKSQNEIVFWTGFDASHYPKQALANAAFIVQAVNSHDALVATLKEAVSQLIPFAEDGDQPAISAAIDAGQKALRASLPSPLRASKGDGE